MDDILKLFAHKEPSKKMLTRSASCASVEGGGGDGRKATPPPEFLSAKRAQNIAICLTKVTALPFEQIASCVATLNPTCLLSVNDVAALQGIAPTEEEIIAAKAAKRLLADAADGLTAAASMREGEKFVCALLEVPQFERKLQVILLLLQFSAHVASLNDAMTRIHSAATRVL